MSTKIQTKVLTKKTENATLSSSPNPEIRCPACNRLLARGRITLGSLEIQCSRQRCKVLILINQHGRFIRPTA